MRNYALKFLTPRLFSVALLLILLTCSMAMPSNTRASTSNWVGNVGQKDILDSFKVLKPTKDGGYIGVGNTGIPKIGIGNSDILVVKFDSDNNLMWRKSYGGPKNDNGYSILEVSDGYIIGGSYAESFLFPAPTISEYSTAWIIKIDFNGNVIWNHLLSSEIGIEGRQPSFLSVHDLISTSDGNCVVLTRVQSAITANIGVVKIDPSTGAPIWIRIYEPELKDQTSPRGDNTSPGIGTSYFGGRIIETLNKDLVVCGGFFDGIIYTGQAMLLSLNSDGTLKWMKRYGSAITGSVTDSTEFTSIKEVIELDAMGNPKSTGYIMAGSVGISEYPPKTPTRAFLAKVDLSGNILMQKKYENDGYNFSLSDIQVTGDSFVMAGVGIGPPRPFVPDPARPGFFKPHPEEMKVASSALIMKVGKDGNFRMSDFQKFYGGGLTDLGKDMSGRNQTGIENTWAYSLEPLGNGYLAGGIINGSIYLDDDMKNYMGSKNNKEPDAFVLNLDENGVTGGMCDSIRDVSLTIADSNYIPHNISPVSPSRTIRQISIELIPNDPAAVKEVTCAGGGGGTVK